MSDFTIAFIGLGTMGRPMATRLLDAGHTLYVYDKVTSAIGALTDRGARAAGSAHAAAARADIVITMLTNGPHVRAATTGPDGALTGMRPGGILIDMSTIDPATSVAVGEIAAHYGVRMLDAPVSGSSTAAADGTLSIMVGGDADVLEEVRPILSTLGRKIFHCGAHGTGVSVKLANQIMAGVSMVAVAEGFRLAEKLSLDPRLLFEVASASSGDCWSLRTRPPVAGVLDASPAENGFAPGFMGDLMRKDLDLALTAANEHGIDLPITATARELYARMTERGLGDRDFSAVFTLSSGAA